MSASADYRALVCVTTCDRLEMARELVPPFADLCGDDRRLDFLLALDGNDESYLEWCAGRALPLLFSEEREGVGLSKNRTLTSFPGYDYYFFVEDDVELLDGRYFHEQIRIAQLSGLPHFSLHELRRLRQVQSRTKVDDVTILHAAYGSAQVSFFEAGSLQRVGGWDPAFAEYRRWGHTEHSYRFSRTGLCAFPFNLVEELAEGYFRWHNPPPVIWHDVPTNADWVSEIEAAVMSAKREFLPLRTLSPYHLNDAARDLARRAS